MKINNINYEFSFIIPCFNCDEYLENCINSIINQNFYNLEIMIVITHVFKDYCLLKFLVQTLNNLKSIRVKRMVDEKWQVKYLISFIKIMERNFSSYLSKMQDQKEIVRFYSTAYNTGIFQDIKNINRFINKKFYKTNHGLYNYSEISLYFFKTI